MCVDLCIRLSHFSEKDMVWKRGVGGFGVDIHTGLGKQLYVRDNLSTIRGN